MDKSPVVGSGAVPSEDEVVGIVMKQAREPAGQISVSLRGSLAHRFARLAGKLSVQLSCDAREQLTVAYITGVLDARSPDFVMLEEGDTLVIGLESDRGQWFPDW